LGIKPFVTGLPKLRKLNPWVKINPELE
jgi:hypothetical protein